MPSAVECTALPARTTTSHRSNCGECMQLLCSCTLAGPPRMLYRDILGLYKVDMVRKTVHVRFTDLSLDWCEGRVPTPEGFVFMRWSKSKDALTYQIDVPAGYSVQVENLSKLKVTQRRFPHGKVDFGFRVEGGYQ